MPLKIYGHPVSLCTRRALLVLEEKKVQYELVVVDFMSGEQKVGTALASVYLADCSLAISLQGKTPFWVDSST